MLPVAAASATSRKSDASAQSKTTRSDARSPTPRSLSMRASTTRASGPHGCATTEGMNRETIRAAARSAAASWGVHESARGTITHPSAPSAEGSHIRVESAPEDALGTPRRGSVARPEANSPLGAAWVATKSSSSVTESTRISGAVSATRSRNCVTASTPSGDGERLSGGRETATRVSATTTPCRALR